MAIDDLINITDSCEIAGLIIDRYYYDERYAGNRKRARDTAGIRKERPGYRRR